MSSQNKYDPFLEQYLKIFQENPRSRVFAPLAEAYRKSGLIEEAIDICKEGLEYHPNFISGIVALARCYFDKGMFNDSITELEKVISEAPDNYLSQRLLAEAYGNIGDKNSSLKAYKMVLFLNPKDENVAHIVQELENEYNPDLIEDEVTDSFSLEDIPLPPQENLPVFHDYDNDSIFNNISNDIELSFEEKPASEIFRLEDEAEDDSTIPTDLSTMTMGELLESQGHDEKALEIFNKILLEEPDNISLKEKIERLEMKLNPPEIPEIPDTPETPEEPEILETPDIPEVPEELEASEVTEVNEASSMIEIPEIPEENLTDISLVDDDLDNDLSSEDIDPVILVENDYSENIESVENAEKKVNEEYDVPPIKKEDPDNMISEHVFIENDGDDQWLIPTTPQQANFTKNKIQKLNEILTKIDKYRETNS